MKRTGGAAEEKILLEGEFAASAARTEFQHMARIMAVHRVHGFYWFSDPMISFVRFM
jgi:hypothetical protein